MIDPKENLYATLTPGTVPSDDPHNLALLPIKRHIL
jgi:hypothetical protein